MNRAPRLSLFPLALAACLLHAPRAAAQDPAAAEALFNKGVKEMEAGNFAVACPAIGESQRLDPRPGTLFTLAECHAKWGKIATALVEYDDYLQLVDTLPDAQKQRHAQRVELAKTQKKNLAPDVPTLLLSLPDGAPKGLVVARDGTELSSASLGTALPVDPGEHVIVTTTASGIRREQKITIARAEKKTVNLEWAAGGAPAVTTDPTAAPDTPVPGTSKQRIAAFVVGGVGIAGLALGGVTGGLALGAKSTVDANCPNKVCNESGANALESGRTMGLVSTVGFAVGGAGVAAAVILWLTDSGPPKPRTTGVSLDVGPDGVVLRLKGAL